MKTNSYKHISEKSHKKKVLEKISKTIVLIIGAIPTFVLPSFSTGASSDTIKDVDGNIYHTVKIGNQVWTVEDLKTTKFNDGTPIPNVTGADGWKSVTTPGYCYYENNPENGKKYGVIYNWYAASSDKIAPKGWRVPTREDQLALRDYLIANGFNYDSTTVGNKVAKSMATKTDWPYRDHDAYGNPAPDLIGMVGNDPQTNNKSGYSALPAGCRWSDGSFHAIGTSVYWWSVTPFSESDGYHTSIHTWFAQYGDNHHHKRTGFCIRLIRDALQPFEVVSGQVPRTNANMVLLKCSEEIQHDTNLTGFSLKTNNMQNVDIDSSIYSEHYQAIVLYLASSATKDDELYLSYSNGNVLSVEQQELLEFSDFYIDNMLPGAAPKLSSATIGKNGDEIVLYFNKNIIANGIDTGAFKFTETTTNKQLVVNAANPHPVDSSIIIIIPSEKLYLENKLILSYADTIVVSPDSAKLARFENFAVKNEAKGLPPKITSAVIVSGGLGVELQFSKELVPDYSLGKIFDIKINDNSAVVKSIGFNSGLITLTLNDPVRPGDTVKLNMEGGKLVSSDNGVSESLTNYEVVNSLPAITYLPVPGKLEAEKSILQYGTKTENTSDVGGGQNVGWIDAGDWLEYAINIADSGNYIVEYRVSGLSNSSIILQLRGDTVSNLCNTAINATGGWQKWTTVRNKVRLNAGKEIIRIHFSSGGINLNWINIVKDTAVSVSIQFIEPKEQLFNVYPNPASDMICIEAHQFKYSGIKIFNVDGKLMSSKNVNYEPVKKLSLNLPNGTYTLVLSNNSESRSKMFVINQ